MNDETAKRGEYGARSRRVSAMTNLVHSGSPSAKAAGLLNPPIHRASTITYDSVEAYTGRHSRIYDDVIYGLYGTETTFALEAAIAALESGHRTVVTSSGTAAISLSLSAFLTAGDHLLVIDTVYRSTRRFCDDVLTAMGVEVSYFDPGVGSDIVAQIRPNTRAIFLETPGSLTFEMPDIAAITAVARPREIITMIDNTWATPLYFRPIEHGIDVSIAAATKYLSGHSDVMLGAMTAANADIFRRLKDAARYWGNCVSPDDCYLVHRGLRTLEVRLERHQRNALELIDWFQQQPEVRHVLYPGIASDAGHAIWRRDFDGATGLFGVLLDDMTPQDNSAFFNQFRLFQLGASWGGFESLIVPAWPAPERSCTPLQKGSLIRVHAGLETGEDLIDDLSAAFDRLRAFRSGGRP
jgi:cystathionine beta-lyase